jgi:hypothetical protein
LRGTRERTQDQQRRRRTFVDRRQREQSQAELCAPPRTSPIATTPLLERSRQGPGIADG